MKKEIREALKAYEKHLNTAKYANFIRLMPNESKELCELYEKHFGKPLTKAELNCGSCKLKAIKRLADDYFNVKKPGRPPKIVLDEPEQGTDNQ